MRKKIATLAALMLIFAIAAPSAKLFAAQSTTWTYGINSKGWFVRTQDAYLPDRTITGLGLSKAEDIAFAIGTDGELTDVLYIADTGNKRVLKYDVVNDIVIGEIKHTGFLAPRGVYVSRDGTLYVADSKAQKIFIFDKACNLTKEISAPTSIAFGDTPFNPYRVAADVRGNLYIISEGVYSGIIQLSGEGEFLGFFSSNKTTITWVQALQDLFFTDRQKEALQDRQPLTFSDVYIDERGVAYSASMGYRIQNAVKKHNMAGKNMLPDIVSLSAHSSVTTDAHGNIFSTDKETGLIFVYTGDGQSVFIFGGGGNALTEEIAGMYNSLMAIAVSSAGNIWTLDSGKGFLQSFTPTEYALSVYTALDLFNNGHYAEAGQEWENVLRYNQMSVLAHNGLGKSYLYRQEYAKTQAEFKLAGNRTLYSQAFWETRNAWLMSNLTYGMFIFAGIILLSTGLKYLDRQKRVKTAASHARTAVMESKWLKHVAFSFSVARHPLDSFYDMKIKKKGSVAGAAVMSVLLFIAYMLYQTSKAFILQYADVQDMDFNVVIGGFLGLMVLFIVCNYLVTSINDGKGDISDIFKIVAYASLPLTLALFGVTVLSYVITLNEVFLFRFTFVGGMAYSGVLLYFGLQEVHGYNFKNTIKSVLITIAFMLIALVVLFNLMILFDQFYQFAEAFVRELIANVFDLY